MAADLLFLVIRLGEDRYAIESSVVEEVVPLVRLKVLPGAPAGIAGVMNYRDDAIPIVDLNLLALGKATPARLATRIVIVRWTPDALARESELGRSCLLGLLVPAATGTLRVDPSTFVNPGVATDGAAYLGPVLTTPEGVVQRVDVSTLLSAEIRDALFRAGSAV
ncbi:MAG: chemotaxis protein CheW [Gemmatimonadota bacterium]